MLAKCLKSRTRENRGVWVLPCPTFSGPAITVIAQIAPFTEPNYDRTLDTYIVDYGQPPL